MTTQPDRAANRHGPATGSGPSFWNRHLDQWEGCQFYRQTVSAHQTALTVSLESLELDSPPPLER